jgi:hypothetical protein
MGVAAGCGRSRGRGDITAAAARVDGVGKQTFQITATPASTTVRRGEMAPPSPRPASGGRDRGSLRDEAQALLAADMDGRGKAGGGGAGLAATRRWSGGGAGERAEAAADEPTAGMAPAERAALMRGAGNGARTAPFPTTHDAGV